ncbi:Uncharacterized protein SCF082_LOCUS30323 [Durusdinium trenchii]|uniref:Uncharacterized protein n=1 Tax=Durusdinium trenchii TaxID=1381693 RepID=A0ABP0MXX9_9DINO
MKKQQKVKEPFSVEVVKKESERSFAAGPKAITDHLRAKDPVLVALKVDLHFDETSLEGATLHFSETGGSIESPENLVLRRPLRPWSQYLALIGSKGREFQVVKPAVLFEIQSKRKAMATADKRVARTLGELESLIRAEDALEEGLRPTRAAAKWEMRTQLGLEGLGEPLCGVGFDLSAEMDSLLKEDDWAGEGAAPKKKHKSCFSASGQKRQRKEEEERLKPLAGSYTAKVIKPKISEVPPMVAFWNFSDFDSDALQDLTFKRWERKSAKPTFLEGEMVNSSWKLLGLQELRRGLKDEEPNHKILLGILTPEEQLLLSRAEVFVLKVDTLPPEKDEEEAKSYYQLRQMATDGFGTDKKIRTSAILRERFTRSCEVAELDKCKKTIQKRVEEQSKTTKTTFDKDLELKHQILPSFKDATEPSKIYEDGLGEIANEQFIKDETDLIQPCMHRLLRMKAPDLLKLSDKSENDLEACGGWHFVLQVLKARGAQNAPPPPPNDAQLFGQKLGVLGLLLRICQIEDKAKRKQKYRKCTPKLLAELLELNVSSPLLKQLHQRCYEAMPGDTAMRVLSIRRTLCATIIWALHLTPELWMNVTKSVQDELSAPTKTLKIAFEFIGCKIEDKPENVLKVQLVGAPKFDQSFYEKQLRNPNQSRKRGR